MRRSFGMLLIVAIACFGCSPPSGETEVAPGPNNETTPAPVTNETVPGPSSNETVPPVDPTPEPTDQPELPAEQPVDEPAPPAEPPASEPALPPAQSPEPAADVMPPPSEPMPVTPPDNSADQAAPPQQDDAAQQDNVEEAAQPTPADQVEGLLEEAPAEQEQSAEEQPVEPAPTSQPADQAQMKAPAEKPAADESIDLALTPENTLIQFVGTHTGDKPDPRTGTFQKFSGQAKAAAGKLESVQVEIETASLQTEIDKLTNHLKSPDFFDVRQYPKAVFKSTKIEPGSDGQLTITGDLTLLETTKPVTFPAKVSTDGGLTLDAQFTINRLDFGMDYGTEGVEPDVQMTVRVSK